MFCVFASFRHDKIRIHGGTNKVSYFPLRTHVHNLETMWVLFAVAREQLVEQLAVLGRELAGSNRELAVSGRELADSGRELEAPSAEASDAKGLAESGLAACLQELAVRRILKIL